MDILRKISVSLNSFSRCPLVTREWKCILFEMMRKAYIIPLTQKPVSNIACNFFLLFTTLFWTVIFKTQLRTHPVFCSLQPISCISQFAQYAPRSSTALYTWHCSHQGHGCCDHFSCTWSGTIRACSRNSNASLAQETIKLHNGRLVFLSTVGESMCSTKSCLCKKCECRYSKQIHVLILLLLANRWNGLLKLWYDFEHMV